MPTLNRKSVAHGLQRALGTSAQLILKGGCPPIPEYQRKPSYVQDPGIWSTNRRLV